MMEKIRLNDGTVLDIQSGATEYALSVVATSVDAIANLFTDSNLERYEILAEDDSVCAIYTKKHLKKLGAKVTEDGYLITIMLEDVNELYERVKTLEAKVESLQSEKEEVMESEEIIEESSNEEVIEEPETEYREDSANKESTEPEADPLEETE